MLIRQETPLPSRAARPTAKTLVSPRPTLFERLFLLAIVLLNSGAIGAFFFGTTEDGFSSGRVRGGLIVDSLRYSASAFIYAYIVFFIVKNKLVFMRLVKSNLVFTALLLLPLLSSLWSLDFWITLHQAIIVLLSSSIGLYFAIKYNSEQLVSALAPSFLFICFLSLFALLIDPEQALHHDQHYPAVRAYFDNKNLFGFVMSLFCLTGFTQLFMKGQKKKGLLLAVLGLLFTLASLSRTCWGNILLIATISFYFHFVHKSVVAKTLGLCLLLLTCFFFFSVQSDLGLDTLGAALGKDVTSFSGRTKIWTTALDQLTGWRCALGYGFESFWLSPDGAAKHYWGMGDFVPYHAHNGWVHTDVNLGWLGVFLLLASFLKMIKKSFSILKESKTMGVFWLVLLACAFSSSMMERIFLVPYTMCWILLVYLSYAGGDALSSAPKPSSSPPLSLPRNQRHDHAR